MSIQNERAASIGGNPLDQHLQTRLDAAVTAWREKLLAMDRRQRLLYFKHLKAGTLEFDQVSPLETLSSLAKTSVPIRAVVSDGAPRSDRALYVKDKTDETLRTSLRRIHQRSNQEFADRGVWTLYLGVLMLQWIDVDDGDKVVDSPVLLVPVRVEKTGSDSPYVLTRTEEDITVNPVLKLKLAEYDVELPEIEPDDLSFSTFVPELGAAIVKRKWRIDQRMVLGNFTFQKEAMYQDLLNNHAEIVEHEMVQLLALGPDSPSSTDFAFDPVPLEGLDERSAPESMYSILDADSSQRRCILTASGGQSFVMDGPPGTGKSQTIANMIAELMARGKTVLFVSEKAAALDVVRDRLSGSHLRQYLFELHSHAATRKEVANELARTLQQRARADVTFGEQDVRRLTRNRRQLTDFATAMNEIDEKLSQSLFSVLGRLTELQAYVDIDASMPQHARWAELTEAELADIREHGIRLGKAWHAVQDGDQYLWRDLKRDDVDAVEARSFRRLATRAKESVHGLCDRLQTIDADLGLNLQTHPASIATRRAVLELLDSRPQGLPTWYDRPDIEQMRMRVTAARAALSQIAEKTAELEAAGLTRWRELDTQWWPTIDEAFGSEYVDKRETSQQISATADQIDKLDSMRSEIEGNTRELGGLLGVPIASLTLQRAGDIARLAKLAAETERPEAPWLNSAQLGRVTESIAVMDALVGHANRRYQELQSIFRPEVLNLDLPGLVVRFRDVHKGMRRWSGAAKQDKQLIKSVSVSGRCDKNVIGQLGEAASWQEAVGEMRRAEAAYATGLGPRYQGPATQFDQLRAALNTARKALELAGSDADLDRLGSQISSQGLPDPRLVPVAANLMSLVDEFSHMAAAVAEGTPLSIGPDVSLDKIGSDLAGIKAARLAALPIVEESSALAGRELSVADSHDFTRAAVEVRNLELEQHSHQADDIANFGEWLSNLSDFESIENGLCHSIAVQRALSSPISPWAAGQLRQATCTAADLDAAVNAWSYDLSTLLEVFTEARAAELRDDYEAQIQDACELAAEMESTASPQIEDWCSAHRELVWAESLEFAAALTQLRKASRTPHQVAAAVEYVVLEAWVDARTRRDPRLQNYRAADRDKIVEDFRALDQALLKNTHARVIERCNSRAPVSLVSRPAQIIKREGAKKRGHKPVRQLLDETASLVQQLKPCFMMSPLSVSQYLPSSVRFDVVIFDEASQVLPSDALNCVYRGKQLIVAGDQKQLPPTDFFSAGVDDSEDGDDNESADFQSVLDLAKGAGGLTALPLNWHYRSRHEDLITYSNHGFYDGALMTFPGAVFEAPDLGVSLMPVQGVYRRGSSRDNPIEAAKIVDRLIWFRRERPDDSIGIVTFSAAQADRITQEVESRSATEPVLMGILAEHDRLDGFFVKSLENVQGDERDTILFSIGYGPDEHGKFTANFGPLNREGGWRRLNVAITRARKRIEVVSSFTSDEMPATNNLSIKHLQRYLDFANRGHAALALDLSESLGDVESVFEEQVIAKVRSWGYDVVPQVGVAGYRIDLGVRHPQKPGLYVLGIECDGAAYHSAQTARDRDRLREQVLVGLGWRIHRIWGLSWWRERALQEARLRAAIEEAIAEVDSGEVAYGPVGEHDTDDSIQIVSFEDVPDEVDFAWTTDYREYSLFPARTRDPKTVEGLRDMAEYFGQVIAIESPVHGGLLDERFRDAWGVGRIGAQLRRAVDHALSKAHPGGPDTDGFYRAGGVRASAVRVPSESQGQRKIIQVAPEEIELAMLKLVQDSVAMDEATLIKQTAWVFGWSRLGAEIRGSLSAVVRRLVDRGLLALDGSGNLRLVEGAS